MILQQNVQSQVIIRKPQINVGLGQLVMAGDDQELVIYGLGSCIGLSLWSPSKKIGVLCHIVMPDSKGTALNEQNPAKYADHAIPLSIETLLKNGVRRSDMQAKMVGGAHTLGGMLGNNIGAKNAEVTIAALQEQRIHVLAKSIGGTVGKTIRFHPCNGKVEVRSVSGNQEVL